MTRSGLEVVKGGTGNFVESEGVRDIREGEVNGLSGILLTV